MTRFAQTHRHTVAALAVVGACVGAALWLDDGRIQAEGGGFLRHGEAGFVVTRFAYVVGPDAVNSNSCPQGMSKNMAEIFALSSEGARRADEGDEAYTERLAAGAQALSTLPDGRNVCAFPEAAATDPHTRRMLAQVPMDGLNLDGGVSRGDFSAPDGTRGVDNQFWRVVGCNRSYQSDGASNGYEEGMYVGEWGILIALSGVDDLQNDDRVAVGIHANADPMRLSPAREALDYATYAIDPDPAFRATTRGRIVDGVLLSEPVDVRFHSVVNSMYLVRVLHDARIRATIDSTGRLEGVLGGYTPVAEMYDVQFGYRNGKNADGTPSDERRRLGSANGAARVLGHTCQGIWQSLNALADGHPDAAGRFTSISTQYRFSAQPAFVIEAEDDDG